jgi:organic hydroperoxide reductase OsmC/OhrA
MAARLTMALKTHSVYAPAQLEPRTTVMSMSQSPGASHYEACIRWQRQPGEAFTDLRYSRAHRWEFDGGGIVAASSAPSSVPLPYSKAEYVDPEEALVAALCSCHMLVFLALVARAGLVVDSYVDCAVGTLGRNARGRLSVTQVVLSPHVRFAGTRAPSDTEVLQLHHAAHEECYIANSVTTHIQIRGRWDYTLTA